MSAAPVSPIVTLPHAPGGEILPPPLVESAQPDQLIRDLLVVASGLERYVQHHDVLLNLAIKYAHGLALRRILAGEHNTTMEHALWEAVITRGEPISLRPLGEESRMFASFHPTLRLLDGARGTWQIGAHPGRTLVFTQPDAAEAVAYAQRVYLQWSEAEERVGGHRGL
jgi:hypothetical protein